MVYSMTIALTRPADKNKYLPTTKEFKEVTLNLQRARENHPGYILERRVEERDTLTITHVWKSEGDYKDFEAGNMDNQKRLRTMRAKFVNRHGIQMVVAVDDPNWDSPPEPR